MAVDTAPWPFTWGQSECYHKIAQGPIGSDREWRPLATEDEVRDFLLSLKIRLATEGNLVLIEREKNLNALADLGAWESDISPVIRSLTLTEYCEGPAPDDKGGPEEWWIFGPTRLEAVLYIKVALAPRDKVKCMSFHRAEYPLAYPCRRGGR